MQAVVLVGGEGTRLRPLTLTQPKPALRLVDRPFVRFMMDWLARYGIDEVILACGFRPELLRRALGEAGGSPRIEYLDEDEPLGTAGPIRLAEERGLLGDRFMVLNGDVLNDLDLGSLMDAHETFGATATIVSSSMFQARNSGWSQMSFQPRNAASTSSWWRARRARRSVVRHATFACRDARDREVLDEDVRRHQRRGPHRPAARAGVDQRDRRAVAVPDQDRLLDARARRAARGSTTSASSCM